MTQKDSEDDDGGQVSRDLAPRDSVPKESNAVPAVAGFEPTGPVVDAEALSGEAVTRPYRREDAAFVNLPQDLAGAVSPPEDEPYRDEFVGPIQVSDDVTVETAEPEVASNFESDAVQPDGVLSARDVAPDPVAEEANPTVAVAENDERPSDPIEAGPADEATAPFAAGEQDLPPDATPFSGVADEPVAGQAEDASAPFSRGSWAKPPPLAETPPWVWRDVIPDIVAPQSATPVDADVPPSARVDAETPPWVWADVVPDRRSSIRQERTGPPAAEEGGSVIAAPLADPEILPEPKPQPAPTPPEPMRRVEPTEAIQPPPVERGSVAPVSESPRRPMLDVAMASLNRQPEISARVEPSWERPAVQSVFQDARPGDFAPGSDDAAPVEGWDRYKDLGRSALRYAGYAVGGYFAFVLVLILVYRFVNPPASSLMLVQALTGTDVQQQWVPLEEISPSLVRAVIVSEDWSFCEHYGIDIAAIEQAIEKSGSGIPRGASTISMQTTKNLFLWNAKSYVRKAVELPLTLMIELIWPKWRILEIYLNVAEWGPGIFGAEAAAQYHFNKPAARLGEREAAQLAASLPNPIIREAGDPGPRTARKASVIQSRMRNAGGAAACVLGNGR